MFRLKSAAAAALLVGLGACTGDTASPLGPESQPLTTISDAAHAGAVPGFYFLPPMVSNPSYSGTFDGGLQPTVQICELVGTVCGPVIATYTTTSGTGGQTVQVGTSSYQVSWHTNQFNLDPARHYRISVHVGAFQLGFADVDVVSTGKELKNVDTQEYIPLLDDRTLPIKFRIETGIAGQVIVTPDSAAVAAGGTQQFTATALDLHGNALACAATWASNDPAVATVDGSGLATGVAPGSATITATCQAASGSATLTVFDPNTPPVPQDDAFEAIGNVTVPVAAPGVLANDTDGENDALQAVPGTYPTTAGGSVTINADGSFSYLSAAGYVGADAFTYTVTDGQDSVSTTVTMTSTYRVWYVDNAAAPGDGRDASPFNTLAGAEGASTAGETVFVRTGTAPYDGGFTLKTGQSLTGQGVPSNVTATLNGQTVALLAAGAAPTITQTAAGPTIQLATNNVVQGVDVASTAGAGIAGSGFGTLTVGSVSVSATGGPALDLSSGDVVGAFAALSSAGSAGAGIRLVGVGGGFSAAGGSITGSAGAGVDVTGGAGTFSYGGDIAVVGPLAVSVTGRTGGALTFGGTIASTGSGISAQGNSGGTIAFNGSSKSLSTGANAGVTLANNTGATVSFGGGGLVIGTTTGTGFDATGGGTVSVTGAGNTVSSAGGVAVSVENTAIGAAGLTFASVSASGAVNGIVLRNTGAANALQVTGAGVIDGSGGTIRNTSGDAVLAESARGLILRNMVIGDAAASAGQAPDAVNVVGGRGIGLTDVRDVVVSNVKVSRTAGDGIGGTGVTNLSVVDSEILNAGDGAGDSGIAFDDAGLNNLDGVVQVANTVIDGFASDGLRIENVSGTLTAGVSGSTISNNANLLCGVSCARDGVHVRAKGSASITLTVNANTQVSGIDGTGLAVFSEGASSVANAMVSHSTVQNSRGFGLLFFAGGFAGAASELSFSVANSSVTGTVSTAISVQPNDASSVRGTVNATTVTGSQVGRGIEVLADDDATGVVAITNNAVSGTEFNGIFASNAQTAELDVTIRGNTVSTADAGGTGIAHGIEVNVRQASVTCLDIVGNSSDGAGIAAGFRTRQRETSTFRMERYTGAAFSTSDVVSFLVGQNTAGDASATVSTVAGSPGYTGVPDGTCQNP